MTEKEKKLAKMIKAEGKFLKRIMHRSYKSTYRCGCAKEPDRKLCPKHSRT